MRKFLTMFTVLFLFIIATSALASDYNYDTKITPKEFDDWEVDNSFEVNDTLYIWVNNPDENAKLNRAILKIVSGALVEFICWNENDTPFNIMRRFIYNPGMHRYEEIGEESHEGLTW